MSNETNESEDGEDGGSGGTSMEGFEYQIDVSVWLALDLVLASKLTHELMLEPATEEDIEATLEEHEPGRVTSKAPLGNYQLIVQAKLRTGDAWTVPGIKALLKHGEARESAAKRLMDPAARYLLVTSAGLNGLTRRLSVRNAGIWPKAASMPDSLVSELPAGSAGRVAIIGGHDEERLTTNIKRLLTESFRVPNARWEECRRTLREGARARMRGVGGGRWIRSELEQVIHRHEGYIASSPELEHYVHPTNWGDLRAAMNARHAALIIGQSGTGKTMATRKLYEELREVVPGLTRVPITLGPQQLLDDRTEPPVLYDIEDPWGRYDFEPKSRPWNDQLARLFATARHDRMVIATSRQDVAQSSGALEGVKSWLVKLEAEHYGASERQRLYQTRIDALPRQFQLVAMNHETTVLTELGTPLEIQKFFDALPTIELKRLQTPAALVTEAIRRAHQDSIERTVIDQIQERKDVRAAAVLWGLLKVNSKVPLSLLRSIEEQMAEVDSQYERGVQPLVRFFVAARNLRQLDSTVSYYHPRVEAGIEQALHHDRLTAMMALRLLLEVLLSPDGPGETWGASAAARLMAAAGAIPELKPTPPVEARERLDAWLAGELAKGGKAFQQNLSLAAAAGSSRSGVSEAARFLLNGPDTSVEGPFQWEVPEHDESWYARMRADPAVKPLVETFIREVLPLEMSDYPASFAAAAERLAPGLTDAFLDAAARFVRFGAMLTSEAIAEGALGDLERFESIVNAAVVEVVPTDDEQREREETELAIINGEYSQDYADHLADNDAGHTAHLFLKAYVDRVRATRGWQLLAQHRHREHLLAYWLRALASDPAPASGEVADAFAKGHGGRHEDLLWHVLTRVWEPRFLDALEERLREGSPDAAVRVAALTCLVERAPERLPAICQTLMDPTRHVRAVELAVELGALRRTRSPLDGECHTRAAAAAAGLLPVLLAEVCETARALYDNQVPALSDAARKLIESASGASEELRVFRVALDAYVTLDVADDVRWLLASASEPKGAFEAIKAAIRHHMTAEVRGALTHKYATVVAKALEAVAAPMPAPLPEDLLALAQASGSPVRRALVGLLEVKPHPEHLQALMRLVRDDWSSRHSYSGDRDEFPIARAAVQAIAKLGPLTAESAEQLYRVAIDSSDSDLRYALFALLVREAGVSLQERLFELAVSPGRLLVQSAAAHALLTGSAHLDDTVVERITPGMLATSVGDVASRFLLLLARRAAPKVVLKAAEVLATHDKRRVLLILAILVLRDRHRSTAERIAEMLPKGHVAVIGALGGDIGDFRDEMLDDLGDPPSVQQVLAFMLAVPEKTGGKSNAADGNR